MSNDRFRFRLWDKQKNSFVDSFEINPNGTFAIFDFRFHEYTSPLSEDDGYIIEQCTGLKDKNGKLIYEGDVVMVEDDYSVCNSDEHIDTGIGAVEWECEMWYIAGDVNNGLYEIDCTRYIEVIGNIHEMEVTK